MLYAAPGRPDSVVSVEDHYENVTGGTWLPPARGHHVPDLCPTTAEPICEVPRSTGEDVGLF